jgi:hypothetical protein
MQQLRQQQQPQAAVREQRLVQREQQVGRQQRQEARGLKQRQQQGAQLQQRWQQRQLQLQRHRQAGERAGAESLVRLPRQQPKHRKLPPPQLAQKTAWQLLLRLQQQVQQPKQKQGRVGPALRLLLLLLEPRQRLRL